MCNICVCEYEEVCVYDKETASGRQWKNNKSERDGNKFGGIKYIYIYILHL